MWGRGAVSRLQGRTGVHCGRVTDRDRRPPGESLVLSCPPGRPTRGHLCFPTRLFSSSHEGLLGASRGGPPGDGKRRPSLVLPLRRACFCGLREGGLGPQGAAGRPRPLGMARVTPAAPATSCPSARRPHNRFLFLSRDAASSSPWFPARQQEVSRHKAPRASEAQPHVLALCCGCSAPTTLPRASRARRGCRHLHGNGTRGGPSRSPSQGCQQGQGGQYERILCALTEDTQRHAVQLTLRAGTVT